MNFGELAKTLVSDVAAALGEGLVALADAHDLDAAYARTIEVLSDRRLAKKSYPDGRYIPPSAF